MTTPEIPETTIAAAAQALRAEGDAPYDEYASVEHLDRIQATHYREAATAALIAALPAIREHIAAEIERHAESIGWYEAGGVWADAIELARGEHVSQMKPWLPGSTSRAGT